MPWIRRNLRGKTVYVRVTPDGQPDAAADGRVDVKYNASATAKVYRAFVRNLDTTGRPSDEQLVELPEPAEPAEPAEPTGPEPASRDSANLDAVRPDAARSEPASAEDRPARRPASRAAANTPGRRPIVIYTDGACTGNPGPAGIGVVIIDGDKRRELSEYLGTGTNNIAELTAILRALEVLDDLPDARTRPVRVHSDSAYSLGLLTRNWKAKANTELVARLRALAHTFPRLELIKVKGHAGIPDNERADELARQAIIRGR